MKCYVCVLSSNDYLEGVLVLNENLKALKSRYKLLCLINDKINEKTKSILDFFQIEYITNRNISLNYANYIRWTNAFDKLHVFSLSEYEKVVYLDCDMLILRNIDSLFLKEKNTMASDEPYTDGYNSAVMIVKPNYTDYKELLNLISKYDQPNKIEGIGDQNIINDYFGNNLDKLGIAYNQMKYIVEENGSYHINEATPPVKNPFIIHYILKNKPFMIDENYLDNDKYLKRYKKYLTTVRNKMKKYEKEVN